ncbi:MAG: glutamate 5-kinase [Acidimicrobiia bacterium]
MRRPVQGRLVAKVGSSSLVDAAGVLNEDAVERTARAVAEVWRAGHPTTLVSSGAVASGLSALGLNERPSDIPGLQVAAAVGQGRLMHLYTRAFDEQGLIAGQVLLTRDVLANREQYLHARQSLDRMLTEGIVPVVNENDTVVVDELRLGDNDRLAAIVSHVVGASLMVILTDTAGLFDSDPRRGEASFLDAVDHTDQRLDDLAGSGPFGSGGAASKVGAARMAAWSGIPTVVAGAGTSLVEIVHGFELGTWVEPRPAPLAARKLWIAFCQPVLGAVTVDVGAENALVHSGTSLLPVGVVSVEGEFRPGDAVDVRGQSGRLIGRGLVRVSGHELREAAGQRGAGEAIHRDDLAVFV